MRKVWIRMWRVWLSDKWSLNLRSKEKKGLFFQKIKNFGQKSCFEFTTYICSDSVFAGLGLRSSASFLSFYFLILLPRWTIFYILLTICTLKDTITQTCSKAFHNISLNNNCFPLFVVPSEANFTFSPNFFSPHWDANFKLSLFFQHIREWISVCVCVCAWVCWFGYKHTPFQATTLHAFTKKECEHAYPREHHRSILTFFSTAYHQLLVSLSGVDECVGGPHSGNFFLKTRNI